jgi:manganese efflux pump family protein
MSLLAIVLIAFGLAMDAFAVSIASGLAVEKLTGRHVFRIGFHFGLFQALMPLLGWLAGTTIAPVIEAWDHWVALGLLGFIGLKMINDSRSDEERSERSDPTRGWSLVTLSVATSIDALAVGLSLAMLQMSIWLPALIIGLVAAGMSVFGITFGHRLGRRWGRRAELVGGLVLIAIGVRIVITHTMG